MIDLAKDRWFSLVNLALTTGAATLWYLTSGRTGWPLIVAILIPWVIRVAAGKFPFRRSRFDGLLGIFGVTALMNVFTAYNRELAVDKWWILLGAMAVYFALISISRRDVWLIAGASGPAGALIAIYFVMSNNWQQWPAEIALFNRLGTAWASIRPSLPFPVLHPNTLAGMIALLLPFTIAFGVFAWQKKQIRWTRMAVISGGIMVGGLIFTSSIGAWLASAFGLGFWFIWELSGFLRKKIRRSQRVIFFGFVFLLLLAGLLIIDWVLGTGIGRTDGLSRLSLARQTFFLIGDFSITGGGLATFPALYAQYVQVTPAFFVAYSNFFFDIWLEQGFLALSAVMILIAGSFWLLLRQLFSRNKGQTGRITLPTTAVGENDKPQRQRRTNPLPVAELQLFRWAAFATLIVMVFHGLIDDALYGGLASPLLFFAPAMVIVVTRPPRETNASPSGVKWRSWVLGLGAAIIVFGSLFFGLRSQIVGQWYANLGALEMARVELMGWPTNMWDEGDNLSRFDQSTALFEQALAVDQNNRTANYRLGMVAMLKRDYETAVAHLVQAKAVTPDYRGVVKSLGYSYVWQNQFDRAQQILAPIPETRAEMAVYSRWWERQNRPDLASKASEMSAILENATMLNP